MLIMNKTQSLNRAIILAPSTKWKHSILENVEWEIEKEDFLGSIIIEDKGYTNFLIYFVVKLN